VKPLQRLAEYPAKQQSLALVGIVENNEVVGGDAAKCSDSGGIPLWINTTVLWRVDSEHVGDLYLLKPGYSLDIDNDENEADDNDIEQAIVLQKTIGAITDACGEFIYTDIFGVERTDFRNRVYEILEPSLAQSYIILDDFIMGEINSTKDIEASLSTKSTAQQQSQAALFQAEQARTVAKGEADAAILRAEGEADSVELRAGGQAKAIKIEAEARAQAIQMLADELEKHGISLIDWNWLETWNGKLPSTLVISDDIGSPLMTIDIAPTPEVPVQNLEVPAPTPEQ
jgi:regulator of protease activity HflC (stomatin/prohibitin superfamily)